MTNSDGKRRKWPKKTGRKEENEGSHGPSDAPSRWRRGTRGGGVWLVRPLRGKKARLKDDTDVGLRPSPAICRGEPGQFTASHGECAAGD